MIRQVIIVAALAAAAQPEGEAQQTQRAQPRNVVIILSDDHRYDFMGFMPGAPRWLEIGVRTNGSVAAHSTLSPRQALTPSPYAIYAGTASNVIKGSVVTSLNNLKDNVTLAAGSNVTITPSGKAPHCCLLAGSARRSRGGAPQAAAQTYSTTASRLTRSRAHIARYSDSPRPAHSSREASVVSRAFSMSRSRK